MAVGPLHSATVILTPGELSMKQQVNMAIFQITNWKLDFKSERSKGLQVCIMMRRKVTSELMTTFFPTILLTTITFATTFFKPFFFEAALSVNLTTMLVMTTIFISKMESLPPTSDIKMIDLWLVFCQMIPFAEVVLLTAMEYKRTEEGEDLTGCVQVAPIDNEGIGDEEIEGSVKQQCPIFSLKTLGKFSNYNNTFHFSLPEGKVLPLLTFATTLVHFGVAAYAYLQPGV